MTTMLISDIQTEVMNEIGLSSSQEGSLVLAWLLAGWRLLNDKVHFHVSSQTLTFTAGVNEQALASTVDWIDDVTVLNSFVKPRRITQEEMFDLERFANTGVSQTDVYAYSIYGQLFRIYPTPTATVSWTLRYGTDPFLGVNAFAGTEDTITTCFLMPQQPLVDAIRNYALMRAAMYDDKNIDTNAPYYNQLWQASIVEARKAVRHRGGRTVPKARIGYPSWTGIPRRNDVYPSISRGE